MKLCQAKHFFALCTACMIAQLGELYTGSVNIFHTSSSTGSSAPGTTVGSWPLLPLLEGGGGGPSAGDTTRKHCKNGRVDKIRRRVDIHTHTHTHTQVRVRGSVRGVQGSGNNPVGESRVGAQSGSAPPRLTGSVGLNKTRRRGGTSKIMPVR